MSRSFLYLLAFATNALVLVFEITGGRLLAPYLGTSVGVWAGLIAVVLGGMALGYHYGGRFADHDASRKRIGLILFAASIAALIAWGLRDYVPTMVTATRLEPTVDALLIGTILFMPAVILLAAVSPFLAKNLLRTLDTSAHVVGELSAAGTAGAIVGAVATGMFLIPSFGVGTILLGVALALFALALIMLHGNLARIGTVTALAVALALYCNTLPTRADGWIAERSTAYNRIIVTEEEGRRAVWTSPFGVQCQMFVRDDGTVEEGRLVEDYQRAHDIIVTSLYPEGPERALFLGGCIAAFPRYLLTQYPRLDATVVEIDPGMTEVAAQLFQLDASQLTLVHEDARVFVNGDPGSYDLIYIDAFGSSGRVPFQLMTAEMFAGVARHLAPDGFMIMNVHGAYAGEGLLYPSVYVATVRSAFTHAQLYRFTDDPFAPQNLVVVASQTRALPARFAHPRYPELVVERVAPQEEVIVLTDDYAPVEGVFRDRLRVR